MRRNAVLKAHKAAEPITIQCVAGAGDIFVFHYSGHGTLFPDANFEEQDETEMIYVEADGEVL